MECTVLKKEMQTFVCVCEFILCLQRSCSLLTFTSKCVADVRNSTATLPPSWDQLYKHTCAVVKPWVCTWDFFLLPNSEVGSNRSSVEQANTFKWKQKRCSHQTCNWWFSLLKMHNLHIYLLVLLQVSEYRFSICSSCRLPVNFIYHTSSTFLLVWTFLINRKELVLKCEY